MFNHLSNFWSPNKYHMHYTIKNYFQHATNGNPILSYKPINWPSNKNIARLNSNIRIFELMKEWILEINKYFEQVMTDADMRDYTLQSFAS